jgi:adenylate kinase family enzyme
VEEPAAQPSRILVYGVTGSGKTTLARRIGEHLGLPWHSIDDLMWDPGWVQVPDELQRERIAAVCGGPAWVIDAAYGKWADVPLGSADLIVGLDFPRRLSLTRLLRRTLTRMILRTRVCNGNVESWRSLIGADAIVVWHFRSYRRKQTRMRHWHATLTRPKVLLFRSSREVDDWLRSLAIPQPTDPAADPRPPAAPRAH